MGKTKALTQRDWQRFGAAALRWADDASGDKFREEVEGIVLDRMAMAWGQGFDAGWKAGVSDAMDDEPDQPKRNPYHGGAR